MKRLTFLVLAPLALAACAHAPGLSTARTTSAGKSQSLLRADMFPSKPGTVWQYEVVAHPPDDPYVDYPGVETVRLEQTSREGGRTTLQLRSLDDYMGEYRFPELVFDERGVTVRGVTYLGPMADVAEGHSVELLRFPLAIGAKWDDGQWVGEVVGEETVKVPAGTFKAWKVGAIGTYDQAYTVVGTYWIAPGVGIVKNSLNTPAGWFEGELIPAGKRPSRPHRPFPKKK